MYSIHHGRSIVPRERVVHVPRANNRRMLITRRDDATARRERATGRPLVLIVCTFFHVFAEKSIALFARNCLPSDASPAINRVQLDDALESVAVERDRTMMAPSVFRAAWRPT